MLLFSYQHSFSLTFLYCRADTSECHSISVLSTVIQWLIG